MKYTLSWNGGEQTREIDQTEFEALKAARRDMIAALDIEENYNGIIDRYIALQKLIVDIALGMAVRNLRGWAHLRSESQRLNREIACLLSTCRQYIDQAKHLFNDIGAEVQELETWFSTEFDARLGYRVCEGIRNSSQHRLSPTQYLSVGGEWLGGDIESPRVRQHGAWFYVLPKTFRDEDPRFRKATLEEMEAKADKEGKVEFAPLIRDYLNGLGVVNSKVRKKLRPRVKAWRRLHEDLLGPLGVDYARVEATDGWSVHEEMPLLGELGKRLSHLHEVNSSGPRTFDFEILC